MKIARKEFLPLYTLLAATHLFYRIFLAQPMLVSSSWITLGLALLTAIPALMAARPLMGIKQPLSEAFEIALGKVGARIWYAAALLLAFIAAKVIATIFSASVLAYSSAVAFDRSVIIIALIVAGLGASVGEMAIANCARITLRLLILVMGAMALGTCATARLEHFFPLLGPGIGEIGRSVLPLAGIILMPMLYLFVSDTCDAGMKRTLVAAAALAALTAAVCLAIYTLSQPTLPSMSTAMSVRVALLMNNGAGGIQLQMPLIILWNACQLLLLSAQLAMCGAFLRMMVPQVGKLSVGIVTVAEAALCLFCPDLQPFQHILEAAAYPVMTLGFILAGALYMLRRRQSAVNSKA